MQRSAITLLNLYLFRLLHKLRWHEPRHPAHPMIASRTHRTSTSRGTIIRTVPHATPLIKQNIRAVVHQQWCHVIRVLAQVHHFRVVIQVPLLIVRVLARRRVMSGFQVGAVMVTHPVEVVNVLVTVRGLSSTFPWRPAVVVDDLALGYVVRRQRWLVTFGGQVGGHVEAVDGEVNHGGEFGGVASSDGVPDREIYYVFE